MTEIDMQNVRRLRTILEEGRHVSLPEILSLLNELPSGGEEGESSKTITLPDALHGYVAPESELWGMPGHYFWELNKKVEGDDFNDYFKCIEALPDLGVACEVMRLKVWGMGKKGREATLEAFARQIPSFLAEEGDWNGSRSAFLAMRSAVDCISHQDDGLENVVLSIVRGRKGLERTIAAIAAMALVVRELSGNLDEGDGGGNDIKHARHRRLLDLFGRLKKENAECLEGTSFSWFASLLFGLEMERDWTATEECRETGLPAEGGIFPYAEAIIVACACGIGLTRDECIKASTLALFFEDRSCIWRRDVFKTVSHFMAHLIADFDDGKEVWQSIRKHARNLLYRGRHEFRTGATIPLASRMEIFIGAEFLLVCDLHDKGRDGDAMEVWASAWNECVTVLYAWPSALEFIPLIQHLFIKAGLSFTREAECVPSGAELMEQLPLIETLDGKHIDSAKVCIEVLKHNLDDAADARIRAKDPELARLLDEIVLPS